jgi:hypothetical protein
VLDLLRARIEELISRAAPADLAPILDAYTRLETLRAETFAKHVLERLTPDERAVFDALLAKIKG